MNKLLIKQIIFCQVIFIYKYKTAFIHITKRERKEIKDTHDLCIRGEVDCEDRSLEKILILIITCYQSRDVGLHSHHGEVEVLPYLEEAVAYPDHFLGVEVLLVLHLTDAYQSHPLEYT